MKSKAYLLIILVAVVFVAPPGTADAQTATVQTVTLPGAPTPWQMAYDGAYIWYAGTRGNVGYVVRIDPGTVLSNPAGALKWWNVTPPYNPEGSAYMVTFGVAVGGGYVWAASAYSGADWMSDLLSRLNPSTGEVKSYWLNGFRRIRAIRYDGGTVWIAGAKWSEGRLTGALAKFDVASESWTWRDVASPPYDVLVDGGYVWFTTHSFVGRLNKASLELVKYAPSSSPAMLAKGPDGTVWLSMNRAQRIGKIENGKITEYGLNLGVDEDGDPYDGPYGLAFDDAGKLWIAGYKAENILQFNPSTASVASSQAVSNRPFYPVKGAAGTLWCWGQGSVELNKISAPAPPKPRRRARIRPGFIFYDWAEMEGSLFRGAGAYSTGANWLCETRGKNARLALNLKHLPHPDKRYVMRLTVTNSRNETTLDLNLRLRPRSEWAVLYLGGGRFTPGSNTVTLSVEDFWEMKICVPAN